MEMRGSTTTRHARNGTTRRTTVNYTNIAERTANALVETRGAGARSNNTTTRQTGVSRRPTQNSTRSLPVYNEQVPDGDVVLLERVRRRSMSENDEGGNSEDETENTPLTGAAPPYTASDPTPVTPRVTISSRGSTSSVESIQDRSENPGSDATTAASSVDVTEPEHARAPVVGMPGATVDTATTSYGGIPTYEEAIAAATNHIADVPEAAAPLRVEQR
ncbi:hypothetical protein FRC11_011729 [Ceratobasidium sp. 423]|nr:hypothetical protein FRC11_011729 [Ceratobasidium sp. 423]